MLCITGTVSGTVQMVGFRRFVQDHARRHEVVGYANNRADGGVDVLLYGTTAAVRAVQGQIERGPARAVVVAVEWREQPDAPMDADSFTVGWVEPG